MLLLLEYYISVAKITSQVKSARLVLYWKMTLQRGTVTDKLQMIQANMRKSRKTTHIRTTFARPELGTHLKNLPALNRSYQPMRILERRSEISLAANSDSSPLGLIQLFITEAYLALIAIHTSLNAATKGTQDVDQEEQKSGDDRSEYSEEEAGGGRQFGGGEKEKLGQRNKGQAAHGMIQQRMRLGSS